MVLFLEKTVTPEEINNKHNYLHLQLDSTCYTGKIGEIKKKAQLHKYMHAWAHIQPESVWQ